MYHDAYTIQRVEPDQLKSFNFVAGMVPFLLNLIQDVREKINFFFFGLRAECHRFLFCILKYLFAFFVYYRLSFRNGLKLLLWFSTKLLNILCQYRLKTCYTDSWKLSIAIRTSEVDQLNFILLQLWPNLLLCFFFITVCAFC